MNANLQKRVDAALNKLVKWRSVFTGWQLGTRSITDAEAQAVRDHREATMLLRAEQTALINVLMQKNVFTLDEFNENLLWATETLDRDYQRRFPGFKSTEDGMEMDIAVAKDTTAGWPK